MAVVFVAAGTPNWGSSRIRAHWVAPHIPDARVVLYPLLKEVTDLGPLNKGDFVIWQKNVNLDIVDATPELTHIWDACDPAWWWEVDYIREVALKVKQVVCSSPALTKDFNEWHESNLAVCIPDRVDLNHYNKVRIHRDTAPVRFIWSGFFTNRICLFAALANLERLVSNGYNIELTVYDDKPTEQWEISDRVPFYYKKWTLETEVETLTAHDIALIPPHPGAWGKVKSNNKKLTAWACGLPVATGEDYEELVSLVTMPEMRQALGNVQRRDIEQKWTVERSAAEWVELLQVLK